MIRRSILVTVLVAAFLLATGRPIGAGDGVDVVTISVSGEASIKVVPDEVIIVLGVETWDKNLMIAKSQNDDIVGKLLALAKKYDIEPQHVQTDYINIEPRYHDDYEKRDFIAFFVRKTVVITLRDISRFENLLSESLLAGANYVHGVDFRTTELRKYRDQARALAIKAAREKADALAKELGRKVTKVTGVDERGAGWYTSYGSGWGSRWGGSQAQNVVQVAGGSGSDFSDSALAPGQLTVSASVAVSFNLEPATN